MSYFATEDYLTPTRAAYWNNASSAQRRSTTPTYGASPRAAAVNTSSYRPTSAYNRAASPAWAERHEHSPASPYSSTASMYQQHRSPTYAPEWEDSPSTPRTQYSSPGYARGRDPTVRADVSAQYHSNASPPRLHHPTTYSSSPSSTYATEQPVSTYNSAPPRTDSQRWAPTGQYAQPPRQPSPTRVTYTAPPAVASTPARAGTRRSPSMVKDPLLTFLPPQHPSDAHRLCLALDLDETLVYARDGPIHIRPFAQELLRHLYDMDCEVIVWTAGERDYAQSVIRMIDPLGAIEHCVYRHPKWWTGQVGYSKNLRALGRNVNRSLLVDNTPDCLKDQPANGLLVSDFEGPRKYDDCLRGLLRVVQAIIDRPHETVPRILADCPEAARRTVPLDAGGSTSVWTLVDDDVVGRSDYQAARYNRDSPQRAASRGRW